MTNYFYTNITRMEFMILVIFFWAGPGCSSQQNSTAHYPMKKVKLTVHLDLVRPDGALMVIQDTLIKYSSGPFHVYKYAYKETFENDDTLLITNKPSYFVFERHSSAGLDFTSLPGNNGVKKSTDSFLTSRTYRDFEAFNSRNDSLTGTTPSGNGSFVQQYVPKTKPDITYPDTSYFYFDSTMQDTDYSLSKVLDSIYKSKVYKVHIIYNPQKVDGLQGEIPRRTYFFELRRAKTNDSVAISTLIEKFKSLQKSDRDLRP